MQTFLVDSSFYQTAIHLDDKRLGKQRVEAMQIIQALGKSKGGWVNHPATKMWRGHRGYLASYGSWMCEAWKERGFEDNLHDRFRLCFDRYIDETDAPEWFRDGAVLNKVLSSHRAALLHKNYLYYQQFGWSEDPEYNYYWPVQ